MTILNYFARIKFPIFENINSKTVQRPKITLVFVSVVLTSYIYHL